jgi:hypothetical protein
MNSPPSLAKIGEMLRQGFSNLRQPAFRKLVVFTQLYRAVRTMQVEHSFASCADNMNMLRPVVVWINDDPKAEQSKN